MCTGIGIHADLKGEKGLGGYFTSRDLIFHVWLLQQSLGVRLNTSNATKHLV